MARYGFPNKEKTEIIEWLTIPLSGQVYINHPENGAMAVNVSNPELNDLLLAAGWLLYVTPVIGQHEKSGGLIFGVDTVTQEVLAWTQEEIAAEAERIAEQEILDLKKDSEYILALVGKDDSWVDTKIDNSTTGSTNAEIVENIRTVLKEITYTQRDVAVILTALYKLGRI
jgi:hypothetical protein